MFYFGTVLYATCSTCVIKLMLHCVLMERGNNNKLQRWWKFCCSLFWNIHKFCCCIPLHCTRAFSS